MKKIYNFSAGPSALPKDVLSQIKEELLDFQGNGTCIAEISHRSEIFEEVHANALQNLRDLMNVPSNYRILFMQGGAIAQNAIIPLNLLGKNKLADYVITGAWSNKSYLEAQRYGDIHLCASSESDNFRSVPSYKDWTCRKNASYLHICTNETIHGVEIFNLPTFEEPLPIVADVSSHILSRPFDIKSYGVLYGGAQKNAGIAGLTIVIVREDLLDRAMSFCPSVFHWKTLDNANSMYNTPPTFAIYVAGLVFKWVRKMGGVEAMAELNKKKSQLLYHCIDNSAGFYRNDVVPSVRSMINIPFFLSRSELNVSFLEEAKANGFLYLKGHKLVGGVRASLYNAMPFEGVKALVDFMNFFKDSHA